MVPPLSARAEKDGRLEWITECGPPPKATADPCLAFPGDGLANEEMRAPKDSHAIPAAAPCQFGRGGDEEQTDGGGRLT